MLCLGNRTLNRFIMKSSSPLPRIGGPMDQVSYAKYFSSIYLESGCYQMRIPEQYKPCTAFSTRYGHYEYTIVPSGLTIAQADFINIMNDVFKDYTNIFEMEYLDSVLMYSDTWETTETSQPLLER